MSNKQNHRRGDTKDRDRTEHGSRWEGDDNSRCASKARSSWKRYRCRLQRRTGHISKVNPNCRPTPLPKVTDTDVTGE